ncbi:MAG: hypothetical protein NVSMB25_12700 [Thermoleophilaceae bacterium]
MGDGVSAASGQRTVAGAAGPDDASPRIEQRSLGHGVELLIVSGQLDLSTIDPLRQRTDEAIARGSNLLLYDLTALDFLDSSVLHLLETTRKRVLPMGGMVTVACAKPVSRAFEITGLSSVFSVESSRERALKRLLTI